MRMRSQVKFPVLGVDLGEKNIGLAWASNEWVMETLEVEKRIGVKMGFKVINNYIKELKIKTIIIGEPEKGKIRFWAKELVKFLKSEHKNLKIKVVPETLSSKKAWQIMSRLGLSFKEKKDKDHGFAALEILKEAIG